MRSFRRLWDLFWGGKLDNKPSLPKYRKPGLFTVSYPRKWLKLTEQGIRVPLGKKVKAWFGLDCFHLPIPTNLDWEKVREVRILPRNGCFYAEFVYRVETPRPDLDPSLALGIDHGVTNWLTCVDNLGRSFIIDGRHLKSLNQGYNRRVAMLKAGQSQGFWSKQLGSITEKRNRQMRDAINKAARMVVSHCLEYGIGTVVLGWNPGQKQNVNLGAKGNQNFVQIPTARLKTRLKQLCQQYGIQFVETEEAYSSQASLLDGDNLPKYGEKPDGWAASGKRIKRGLYRTVAGYEVNADCNGAANILRKVAGRLGLCLDRLGRGALTTPLRVRLWATQESPSL